MLTQLLVINSINEFEQIIIYSRGAWFLVAFAIFAALTEVTFDFEL